MPPDTGISDFAFSPDLFARTEGTSEREHRIAGEGMHDAVQRYLPTASVTSGTPLRMTSAEAVRRIRELRKGNILPEGMTIRAMIEEGRA